MAIRWSALRVSEAMDMAEEFVKEADLPLSQAKIIAEEAKTIVNLPEYMTERLNRLIWDIERIGKVKGAIEAVRNAIPGEAIEEERERLKNGSQLSIV